MKIIRQYLQAGYERIYDSFWFLPLLISVVGLLLAELLVRISDIHLNMSVDGARAILTAIAGSTFGATVTMFSITASVLATASTAYGPRLVRNFMNDRRSQFVLGVYAATFLYALDTLRFVRSAGDVSEFVPVLAVYGALLFAIINVAVLIYFIHHVVKSTQISTLLNAVRLDIYEALQNREKLGRISKRVPGVKRRYRYPIRTKCEGYVTDIHYEELALWAQSQDIRSLHITVQPGDYVYCDKVIGYATNLSSIVDCDRALTVGSDRTSRHDVRFALQQPLDVLLRAMSPGTNDPFTAINALYVIEAGLHRLLKRPHHQLTIKRGYTLITAEQVAASDVLRETIQTLQGYTDQHTSFTLAYLAMLQRLMSTLSAAEYDQLYIAGAIDKTIEEIATKWPGVAYSRR